MRLNNNFQIDVGGQRDARKWWIQYFDKAKLLLFLAAVSEYDQVLAEDLSTNRLKESLDLFGQLINNSFFKNTDVLIFLNKTDLLEEKLKTKALKNYFQDYDQPNEIGPALEYFAKLFLDQNDNFNSKRFIISKPTCAVDTENIKAVSKVVTFSIMKKSVLDIGLE